jgi:hypothetical protein
VEMWLLPDGSRIVELSTKSVVAEALTAAVETRAYLEERGLALSQDSHTKTKTTLEFFAGDLSDEVVTAESVVVSVGSPALRRRA